MVREGLFTEVTLRLRPEERKEATLINWRESRDAGGPLQVQRTALVKPLGRRPWGGQGPEGRPVL